MPLHDLFCCSEECSSNHIATRHFKSYCGCPGVPQARKLTNQALDNHVTAVHAVYYVAENVRLLDRNATASSLSQAVGCQSEA